MTQVDQPEDDDSEDRLAGDAALYARLHAQKFQGPEWERFVHDLLAYGLTRIKATIGVMRIASPTSGAGIPTSRGDVEELAADIVLAGFRVFVKCGLVERKWNPAQGSSLRTYFVGACKLVLREKLRDWMRRATKLYPEESRADLPEPGSHNGAGDHFADYFERVLEQLSKVELRIFFLKSEGLSYAEIGTDLGLTERAVERRVSRARNRLKSHEAVPAGEVS